VSPPLARIGRIGRAVIALSLGLALAACGGGGGGGGSSYTPASSGGGGGVSVPLTNFTTITFDGGPPDVVAQGGAYNEPFVSVTLCAPGSTTNCQTIDHVLLDTGSVGLRLEAAAISPTLLAGLSNQIDASGNPVGECYQFSDGYVFGSVRQADFTLGGASVAGMPLVVVGDGGQFASAPTSCSSGAGTFLNTVKLFGANGVLGIGVTSTDCGTLCATSTSQGSASYYDCPASGCGATITRAANTTAPFEQLPNPVAAFPTDNNGTVISLPSVPPGGVKVLTGTLYFGIGTQTNNGLGAATVLPTTTSTSSHGPGLITVNYNNQSLPLSYIDSGSSDLFFVDTAIPACTDKSLPGYYCPPSPVSLALTLRGQNGASTSLLQTLNSAQILLNTSSSAIPGTGYNPTTNQNFQMLPSSFDLGIPFFYGRAVYTAIEGRNAGGRLGPYVAF
jgi:Protein of unknown function (DUF3443)